MKGKNSFAVLVSVLFAFLCCSAAMGAAVNGTYHFVSWGKMENVDWENMMMAASTGPMENGALAGITSGICTLYDDGTFELKASEDYFSTNGTYTRTNNYMNFYPNKGIHRSGYVTSNRELAVYGAARPEDQVEKANATDPEYPNINESFSVAVRESDITNKADVNGTYYVHSWSYNSTNTNGYVYNSTDDTNNWINEDKFIFDGSETVEIKTLMSSENKTISNSTDYEVNNGTIGIPELNATLYITNSTNGIIGVRHDNDVHSIYVGVRDFNKENEISGKYYSVEWQNDEVNDRDSKIIHKLNIETNDNATVDVTGQALESSEGDVDEVFLKNGSFQVFNFPLDNGTIIMNSSENGTISEGIRISPDGQFSTGFAAVDSDPETLRVGITHNATTQQETTSSPVEAVNQTESRITKADTSEVILSSEELGITDTPVSQRQEFTAEPKNANGTVYRYQIEGLSQTVEELELRKLQSEEADKFEYTTSEPNPLTQDNDGDWWLSLTNSTKPIGIDQQLDPDKTYCVNFVVFNDLQYDVNGTSEYVTDPNVLVKSSDTTSDGTSGSSSDSSGGGGCLYSPSTAGGWSWLILLAIPALALCSRFSRTEKA